MAELKGYKLNSDNGTSNGRVSPSDINAIKMEKTNEMQNGEPSSSKESKNGDEKDKKQPMVGVFEVRCQGQISPSSVIYKAMSRTMLPTSLLLTAEQSQKPTHPPIMFRE
ncbi:hypothetical protein ACF0H5_018221 [Mactra antiquata]